MLKKLFLVINFMFPVLVTQCSPVSSQAHNPLMDVKNYKIYYGSINDSTIEKLSSYDMVIIDSHEITKEQVSALKAKGTIVLGYISIMEVQMWDAEFMNNVRETDYLKVNGKKVYIKEWDTYLMDISNKHYQQLLLNEVNAELIQKDFDGTILDTVGDIDDYYSKNEKIAKPLRKGYVRLLQIMNNKYNDFLLLQNWGFKTLDTTSKDYVDAIMWEDFNKKKLLSSEWAQNWIKNLQTTKKKKNIAVFTVTPDSNSASYSKKQGFIPYQNKNSIYDK